jgi:hypothetical protein
MTYASLLKICVVCSPVEHAIHKIIILQQNRANRPAIKVAIEQCPGCLAGLPATNGSTDVTIAGL